MFFGLFFGVSFGLRFFRRFVFRSGGFFLLVEAFEDVGLGVLFAEVDLFLDPGLVGAFRRSGGFLVQGLGRVVFFICEQFVGLLDGLVGFGFGFLFLLVFLFFLLSGGLALCLGCFLRSFEVLHRGLDPRGFFHGFGDEVYEFRIHFFRRTGDHEGCDYVLGYIIDVVVFQRGADDDSSVGILTDDDCDVGVLLENAGKSSK